MLVRIDPSATKPRRAEPGLFGDVLALFASERFVVEELKPALRLDTRAIDRLAVPDFHVLRDLAIRAKLIASEPDVIACDNCDAELTFDNAALPIADLDDRYEGEHLEGERVTTLSAPIVIEADAYEHVRMKQRSVADARVLWRELGKDRPFRITPKLLLAMGVVALESKSGAPLTDLRAMSRALIDAPDDTWREVEETFLALAYPSRAITTLTCAACETVHDLEVPWPRELEPGQYHAERSANEALPSAIELEAHARRIADTTWKRMNAGGLTLRLEVGVAEVDSGGVPMLGSYTPEPRDDGGTDFVVRVYYRTFERAFRDDARFDWRRELEETIEHEAQHHLYYLSGHDPMDEQERAESEREAVRRAGGEKRYRKLQRAAIGSGVWEIVRALVPPLALVVIVVALLSRCAQ